MIDPLMRLEPLSPNKVVQAFPLIQALRPNLSLDGWNSFAADHFAGTRVDERGILAVENRSGYILGLSFYTVYMDIRHGRTLLAKDAVVLAMLRQTADSAFSLLIDGIENVARESRCAAIHTSVVPELPGPQSQTLRHCLTRHGHRIDHSMFCKALPGSG